MAATGKKLLRSKSGLKIVEVSGDNVSPFLMREPVWVPDNQCPQCTECKAKFDFMRRRHHCRRCGQCFCNNCCDIKLPLPRMCFVDPVRLCQKCAQIAHKENEFFDRHIKTLTNGACFHIDGLPDVNDTVPLFCKLSSDHRWISFTSDYTGTIEDIDLLQIHSAHIHTSGTDMQGNVIPSGMSLHCQNNAAECMEVKLTITNSADNKQCIMWIAAMQKALKLIFETREVQTP